MTACCHFKFYPKSEVQPRQIQMTACDFLGNSATYRGGGILNNQNATASIDQCSFTANTAGDFGGAMYLPDNDDSTISNTLICNNSPASSQIYPNGNYTDLGGNCISEFCDSEPKIYRAS